MKSVLIRCDANESNGYGHLSRCLNIARGIRNKYRNFNIAFIGDFSSKAISCIDKYQFTHTSFSEHEPENANPLSKIGSCDYLLLDRYRVSQHYVNALTGQAFKFSLVADGSTSIDISKADLVINYAINGTDFDYKASKQALGLKYFPVKPELKGIREANLLKGSGNSDKILVMIGGHDVYGVGSRILDSMDKAISNKEITFISSASWPDKYMLKRNELIVRPFVEKMEEVYQNTDFSVTGGGLSKYESCFCRIKNACIPQNMNEYEDSLFFEAKGLTKMIGIAYEFDQANVDQNISGIFNGSQLQGSDIFHTDSLENLVEILLD